MALSHCTSMPISKREEKKKGRSKKKKKELQPFLFIAWDKPFHIQPEVEAWGAKKRLSRLLL